MSSEKCVKCLISMLDVLEVLSIIKEQKISSYLCGSHALIGQTFKQAVSIQSGVYGVYGV